MCKTLEGKVALVTGAGQGIGREIALTLADNGADVCVGDVNLDIATEAVGLIREKGCKSEAYKFDVSNYNEVESSVQKILDNFGRIDILVNNAGITRDNLLIRMSENDWDFVININLKGTFNCTKLVAKSMMKKRYGKIVNIASVIGIKGNPGQANYSASKGGVISLTKTCAKELGGRNINVNAIAPGYISTKMTDVLTDEVKNKITSSIPLQKLGTPKDVANACLFLVSSDSDYITGQTLQVDGGIIL
ncbi:3-oxoacyl-[acyl-carrier-protein] reductase [bacterium]